jgi:acetyl esterase/lipase
MERLMARSQRPPRGTTVSPVEVDGIPAEWVLAPGAGSDSAVLYLHGGAFVMGSPATHRELAARVSAAAGAGALSLDFRLAPEFPFPAAVEDAKTAYRWLLDRGYPPGRLGVGGDSSGAGLALQALIALRDDGVPMPAAAFLMSPVTDWVALDGESYESKARVDPLLSRAQCRHTADLYAGGHVDDAPLLRPGEMDLAGLPPLWIQVGECEVLLSDGERLAAKAAADGVEVDFERWPGMWHVFQAAARYVPEARESLEELATFLRDRLGTG